MRRRAIGVAAAVLSTLCVVGTASPAHASSMDRACEDVEVVFAAGSGQDLGEQQSTRLEEQLIARVNAPATLNYYELGTDAATGGYGGSSYDPVDVDKPWNGNPGGAYFSGGMAFEYGASVDKGVGELFNYLQQRQKKCTSARFVLGGFSQGAQVVGQTLEKLGSEKPGVLDRVDFAALFGDPKLHLPEGAGFRPPACRGQEYSTWRRVVPNCQTDGGSLDARQPYLPAVMRTKTGLWCYDKDFVCGSSKNPFQTAGHTYFDEGGAIDLAAIEIAGILKRTVPEEKRDDIDSEVGTIGTGTTGLDVAFVIDTTGSMSGRIEAAKDFARGAAAQIAELRGRVALIAYKDEGDEYTATIFSDLQSDLTGFRAQLDTLTARGGGDTPEALLHALTTTLNGLDWRPGATKAAVVVTDAGFHEPDRVDGSTVASVAKRALEIDPVNVYPVVPSFLTASYQELADLTTGEVIEDSGDTEAALTSALTKLRNRPVPLLPMTDYYGMPGEEFRFDASRSYVLDSEIVDYEWDFDGDGTFDLTTTTPTVTHVYDVAFDGVMQVRVTASDGGLANASAFIHVGGAAPGAGAPGAPTGLKVVQSTPSDTSTATLSWEAPDARATSWVVSLDGVPIGRSDAATRTVDIGDLRRDRDLTFSVAGLGPDLLGESASVTLPRIVSAPPASGGGSTPPASPPAVEPAPEADDTPTVVPTEPSPAAGGALPTASPSDSASPAATHSPTAEASVPPVSNCATAPAVRVSRTVTVPSRPVTVAVQGAPGAQVELLAYSRPSTAYRTVRQGALDATGSTQWSIFPGTNTRLFVRCLAEPSTASTSVVVNVRTAVSLSVVRNGVRDYTFQGRVLPRRAGQLLTLYRVQRDGTTVQTAQLTSDGTGTYRLQRRFLSSGLFSFIVRSGSNLTNAAGSSGTAGTDEAIGLGRGTPRPVLIY